ILPDAEPLQAGTPTRRKFASFGMPANRFKRLQSASPYNARRHPAAKPRKATRKLVAPARPAPTPPTEMPMPSTTHAGPALHIAQILTGLATGLGAMAAAAAI